MPCSTRAWYDVTPEVGNLYSPGARKSPLEFEYPVYESTNEMLGSAIRFSFRRARLGRMWRLLHSPPRATDPIMVGAMVAVRIITDLITGVIRAPSLWRWAIGLITATGEAIMLAAPITSGNRDIGHRGTGSESGSTAITSCEEDIIRL